MMLTISGKWLVTSFLSPVAAVELHDQIVVLELFQEIWPVLGQGLEPALFERLERGHFQHQAGEFTDASVL